MLDRIRENLSWVLATLGGLSALMGIIAVALDLSVAPRLTWEFWLLLAIILLLGSILTRTLWYVDLR